MAFQVPLGAMPDDTAHLLVAPLSAFAHGVAGVLFGVMGPVQFVRARHRRFGVVHRVSGRIFMVARALLGLSGLSILLQVTSPHTPLVDVARGIFSVVLLVALVKSMAAIKDRDFRAHRTWAIRAWAVGMGIGTVALVFFPIYVVTGQAPTGVGADVLFVGSWLLTVAAVEVIIRRTAARFVVPDGGAAALASAQR